MLWIVAADAGDELGDRTFNLVEIHVRFDDVIDANVLRHENLHSLLLRIWPTQGYVRVTTTGKVESRFYNKKTVVKALVLGKLEPETTSQEHVMLIIARYLILQFLVCYTGPAQCLLLISESAHERKRRFCLPRDEFFSFPSDGRLGCGENRRGRWTQHPRAVGVVHNTVNAVPIEMESDS